MKVCLIAAPMTGSGKTTVTLGLLAALRQRGISVQPFKVGPDFIDPGLHEIAAGVASHNLDGWMVSRESNRELFTMATQGRSAAVVEGVMGLFDGYDGLSNAGSTAEMAQWLDLPVILVVDAHGLGRSAAAIVHGLRTFDEDVKIAGVILNRIAGEGHYRILADAIVNVPILGWLPQDTAIEIPERHLGLLTARETNVAEQIHAIGDFFLKHIDFETLWLHIPVLHNDWPEAVDIPRIPPARKRVALAIDPAFSFYYRANRLELERAGSEVLEFSPLSDRELPECEFLYIGGGYPELYRRELEQNVNMRRSVRRFIESGRPFYAECGGLMYLAKSIEDSKMVGILPTEILMTDHLVDFGYCEVTTRSDSILGPSGTKARGHQFHYSRSTNPSADPIYTVRQGTREYGEGFRFENGIASYVHLHFLSNPALCRSMLQS
jgi:cobyrinic acid a,c-diamide synthase